MNKYNKEQLYMSMYYGFSVKRYYTEVLGLGGTELLVYSVIASFSENDSCTGIYTGSVDYLARTLGISASTVRRALQSLCEKKLIIRDDLSGYEYRSMVGYYCDIHAAEKKVEAHVERLSRLWERRANSRITDEHHKLKTGI